MLDSINLMTEIPKAEYKQEVRELKRRLAMLQQTVRKRSCRCSFYSKAGAPLGRAVSSRM